MSFTEQLVEQILLHSNPTELIIGHAEWAQVLSERSDGVMCPVMVPREPSCFMGLKVVKRDGPVVIR